MRRERSIRSFHSRIHVEDTLTLMNTVVEKRTERLRVLFVNRMACLERGGGETFDLEISRNLPGGAVVVSYLCSAPLFGAPPLPLEGARLLHTPWLRRFPWDKVKGGWRVRRFEFEWFERRAARWVARHQDEYDIIQVCELPNLVYWLKKRGVKVPVVMRLTAPNLYDPRGGARVANALIASGTTIEKLRNDHYEGLSGLDVTDVPNAVDPELFRPQPSDFRPQTGIGDGEFVVLYVARFQAFKNHAMLVEAFRLLLEQYPSARLVLVGSGPLRERIQQQAKSAGIEGRVLFLGEVPFNELPAVYAAADLKVVTSDYESFCFAAIEAMSAGLPVLTTDCGWVPRLVADGAGVVTPVGDAKAFASAMERLARDSGLRKRLGAAARERVLARHTWRPSAQKLLSVYQRILTPVG